MLFVRSNMRRNEDSMKNLEEVLVNMRSVGIAGHVRPDGDCVGSCLATYNYIKTWHPDIAVSLYLEPIPNIFKFISHSDEIISDFSLDASYDLFIVQDCSDLSRIGGAAKYFNAAAHTVCIDHHVTNNDFADDNYIFPDASSTSELIYGLLDEERITKEIAESIYTGIVHDTGVFQYSCTSKRTMEIAGSLMEKGIEYTRIIDDTFYTKTWNQNRIMGLALLKSKLHCNGAVISSVITEQEMKEYDVLPKHLDGIVSQLRVTKDVEVSIFLYQTGEEDFKVSMRSVNYVDVATICLEYGGGGHVRAAGCTMSGESDEIIEKLVDAVRHQLNGD
jgi:phosphoesterase RecJ-like protein